MNFSRIAFVLILSAAVLLVACSDSDKPDTAAGRTEPVEQLAPFSAERLMPEDIETYDVVRTTAVNSIQADQISALGRDSVYYGPYAFVGLSRADYSVKGAAISVELAQFNSASDAYGFYAIRRPLGATATGIGAESYNSHDTTAFVTGPFVATLISDATDADYGSVSLLAQELNSRLKSDQRPPQFFVMFPLKHKIVLSNQYFAKDYLGIPGLDDVYTTTYDVEGDTIVFFLTMDSLGGKYIEVSEWAAENYEVAAAPDTIPFVEGYHLMFDHPPHGTIVTGLVRYKLVGIVNYGEGRREWLSSIWVLGLQ